MLKRAPQTGWIGHAMTRREDDALLRGAGQFTDNLAPEDTLILEVVRSPAGPARLQALDVDDAAAAAGVVAVFTASDLGAMPGAAVNPLLPDAPLVPMTPLARDRIACAGQPIAAIVADSRGAAQDAAELIDIDTTPDTPTDRLEEVSRWQTPGARPQPTPEAPAQGRRVTTHLDHPRVAPFAMEPRAALAIPDGDGLTVWLSTQTPLRARDDLAHMLGLPPARLHVIAPDVGGAFGGKASIYPEDVLTAFAALRLRRPVKWTASRSEDLMAATHGRGAATQGTLDIDAKGRITALAARLTFPIGHWMPYSALAPASNAGRILPGPYLAGQVDIGVDLHLSDLPAVNIYRGAGRPEAAMLMERLMDKAARAAGLDPLEMRRRNIVPADRFPHATPTGAELDSGDYAALLDRLEADAGYADLRRRQARRRDAGEVVGIGVALYVEPCGQGWETARLTLNPDGGLTADTGASAQGQGRETALAQLVADTLSVEPARVQVREGDSAYLDAAIGALASRSTAIGGSAMLRAARSLHDEVIATLQRLRVNDWPGWDAAARAIDDAGLPPVSVHETYTAPREAWASGAVLAQVAIDPDTGSLRIEAITWVDDAGRVLNPLLVGGQLLGGMAQGIGTALMERLVLDDEGQLLTGSLMDYALPRAADMPGHVALHSTPTTTQANALGAKGVGEAGCIGVPAALLNAAQDAVSPHTDRELALPLTSERLWRALNDLEEIP